MTLSHLVWEIPNVFMHSLHDKKLRHSHIPGYGPNWLRGIVVNHSLNLAKFEFFLSKFSKWGFYSWYTFSNHHWTHPTSFKSFALFSDWHPNSEIFILNASSMVFPNFQRSILLHSRQNLKQSACAKLILKNDNLPITPCNILFEWKIIWERKL